MIVDKETNCIFLPDSLLEVHPDFFVRFSKILGECNIKQSVLPNTKDIWAVDYMPIQTDINKFIQFVYNPDYLQGKKWQKTISDVDCICEAIGIKPIKSNILLDGGNIIRATDKIIMCDKVFTENPNFTKKQLINELQKLFQIDHLFFVPQQPKDFIGHADGMMRFLNNNTVIINDYSNESSQFRQAFHDAINDANLDYIEIPHNPYRNAKNSQANGIYINYLQMTDTVIIPTFGIKEDEIAVKQFEDLFCGQKIATIDSNEIADKGGILNCITWNILQ